MFSCRKSHRIKRQDCCWTDTVWRIETPQRCRQRSTGGDVKIAARLTLSKGSRHLAARLILSEGSRHLAAKLILSEGSRHLAARLILSEGSRHLAARLILYKGSRHLNVAARGPQEETSRLLLDWYCLKDRDTLLLDWYCLRDRDTSTLPPEVHRRRRQDCC